MLRQTSDGWWRNTKRMCLKDPVRKWFLNCCKFIYLCKRASKPCFSNQTLKGQINEKWNFCHHLLTLMSFQTCMTYFLLLNTKYILKNVFSLISSGIQNKQFFQIPSFVFLQKKPSHTGLETAWGWVKDVRLFSFGWTIHSNWLLNAGFKSKFSDCSVLGGLSQNRQSWLQPVRA